MSANTELLRLQVEQQELSRRYHTDSNTSEMRELLRHQMLEIAGKIADLKEKQPDPRLAAALDHVEFQLGRSKQALEANQFPHQRDRLGKEIEMLENSLRRHGRLETDE